MPLYYCLCLPLLIWAAGTAKQLCCLVEGSVSSSIVPEHQLHIADHRPQTRVISPLCQKPAQPPQCDLVLFASAHSQNTYIMEAFSSVSMLCADSSGEWCKED